MPCFLANSAIPTPASPSFKIDTICDSVNLDFFMASPVMPGESFIHCVRGGEAYGPGMRPQAAEFSIPLVGRRAADEIGSFVGATGAFVDRDLWVREQWASSDDSTVAIWQLRHDTLRSLVILHPADECIHQPGWARSRANESVVNSGHEKQSDELHRSLLSTHLQLYLFVVVNYAFNGDELIR